MSVGWCLEGLWLPRGWQARALCTPSFVPKLAPKPWARLEPWLGVLVGAWGACGCPGVGRPGHCAPPVLFLTYTFP